MCTDTTAHMQTHICMFPHNTLITHAKNNNNDNNNNNLTTLTNLERYNKPIYSDCLWAVYYISFREASQKLYNFKHF